MLAVTDKPIFATPSGIVPASGYMRALSERSDDNGAIQIDDHRERPFISPARTSHRGDLLRRLRSRLYRARVEGWAAANHLLFPAERLLWFFGCGRAGVHPPPPRFA